MGSKVTQYTTLGKRAKPIRTRVRHLLAAVEANPPKDVRVIQPQSKARRYHGGKHFLSPIGYLGIQLYEFSVNKAPADSLDDWYFWHNKDGATDHLRQLVRGSSSRHRQLNVIEAWLPSIETKHLSQWDSYTITKKELAAADKAFVSPAAMNVDVAVTVPEPEPDSYVGIQDLEIVAMAEVIKAINVEGLDNKARSRVLYYAADRLGLSL